MSDFLDLIFRGTSLGVEQKFIEIQYDFPDSEPSGLNTKEIAFQVNIPYAGTQLSFIMVIKTSKFYSPPVLKFQGSFSPNLYSIANWHPRDSNAFLNIVQEIREDYKQYNEIQLRDCPEIYKEYLNFIEKEPNDIEVMVYPNKNIVFIIRLNVDISHVPQLKTDSRLLMEAFFRNGDISDVRLTVSISDTLCQVLSMSDFTVPSSSRNIINCKHLIEQKYNNEILGYFPKPPTNDIHPESDLGNRLPSSSKPKNPTRFLLILMEKFLNLVGGGLYLGIENKTVDVKVEGLTKLSRRGNKVKINSLKTVIGDKISFQVSVPYAQNYLTFGIELQPSAPNCPPNVVYYADSYLRPLESLVSLSEWDFRNQDSLLNITKEVREKYKSRFVNQLHKKRPILHKEYWRFVEENISDDIEVFIERNDVIFLIRLRFSASQIVEQEGDDRILLKITFRGGLHDNFYVELIPTGIWNRVLNLISLPVPKKDKFKHATRYKFLLEQRLNEGILNLVPKSALETYISSPKLCFNGVKPEEFLKSHPVYLSYFLHYVSNGICLGVENVNIHIKERGTCSPCICSKPGPSNAKCLWADETDKYTVLLPYAETELEFSFYVAPDSKPKFIFDMDTFTPDPSSLPSLEMWDASSPNILLNVIGEIRELYKEHFVTVLQKFPFAYLAYDHLISATLPENVEVFVTEEQNCIFLIRLTIETSHIPKLKDARLLLHVLFKKGDVRVMKMRIISDDNFDEFFKSIKFSVTELHKMVESTVTSDQPNFQYVLTYKLLIERQLNQEIFNVFPRQFG